MGKVEKDNACDRTDACEEASKVAKVRAGKAEEEVAELMTKARQLETELDMTNERFTIVSMQLEEKEKSLLAAEAEMNALNRRVQQLEEDLEMTKLQLLLMTLEEQRKYSRTKLRRMTRGLKPLKKNSKLPEKRPRLQTLHMTKWPRNWLLVSLNLRRLRKEQTLEKPKSLNWRRS